MKSIDRLVAWFSPERAVRRMAARSALAYYEGAEPSRLRKFHRERGTANQLVRKAAKPLRDQARHLERNHDIVTGALRTFANNVVGASGVGIEPQPRRRDGTIHQDYADRLAGEIQAVETELGDGGRVLIRASGTEPLLRVMVEAVDPAVSRACAERLVEAVQAG